MQRSRAALEPFDRESEGIDHIHVERVGRLIEQQHVRVAQRHQAEHHARAVACEEEGVNSSVGVEGCEQYGVWTVRVDDALTGQETR